MPPGERPPRGAGGLGLGLGRLIQALAAAACFGLAGSQATTPTVTVTLPTVTPSVTASVTLSVEPNCSTWENGETWFEGSCRKHVPSGADEVYCLEKLYPLSVSHEDETTLHAVDEDHNAAPFNLLVLFGTFALGAIMRYVVMDTIIPFTVVMFLCGCLYGAIGRIAGKDSSFDKYMNLADMNPHLILYSFLPVLIFESAFAMEISVFRKVIVQCVLLAVPGLIAATAMTGYTARMMNEVIPDIHYDWSIEACFLFGTILSATDPVAVVALLKELGASQLISTMIEGESLFNDGTAIVFFNVLILAVEKESCHVTSWDTCTDQCFCPDFECTLKEGFLDVLLEFLRVSLGGLGVGLVMGMITVFSLERVFNDTLTEVTITVVSAYITFFVCEAYGKVSGVLGLVMLGCFLSYFRNCISPEVEHTLHHFWEMSAFLINSCIFALAGMIVSLRAISDVDGWDVLYLLLTYVVINVVRSLVLLMFWPILNLFEYKLTWRTFLLVAWGGLRGAVGLSLALMLNTSNDVVQPNVKEKIMFHTAGIVLLTLIINGITSRFLVSGLGLNAVELRRKLLMREKFTQLEAVSQDEINDLRKEPLYYDCNWKVTDKLVDFRSNLPDHMIDPYNSRDEDLDIKDPVELFNHNSEAARMAYLHTASSSIHKQYAQGKLSPHSVRSLGRMVQTALELTPDKRAASYANPQGFIQASYLNTELQPPPLGLRGCSYAGGKAWTSSDAIAMLGELVRTDPDLANYARAVRTRHASLTVLHGMRANLKGMEHEGRIDGQDKEALKEVIKKRMKRIKRDFPKQMLLPTSTECLELASWYPGCEPEVKSCLAACVETRFIEKDVDNSFLKAVSKELGQRTDKSWCCPGLFIIVTGIVQVRLGRKMYQMGAGHTVGLHSLLTAVTEGPPTHGSERFSEVFAETDCTVGFIARHQIIALLPKYSGFFTEIWKACGASAAFFLMGMDPSHKLWKTEKLRHVSNGGYCEFILDPSRGDAWDKEKRMKIPEGSIAVVLKGTVWEFSGADMIRGPDLLPPGFKYGTFGHHAVVYFIPEEAYGNTSTRAQQRWGRLKSKVRSIGIWSGLRGPHYARCALSWAFKRSPPPDRAISPTSVPLQALLPLPMREIPLPQVLQRSQPRPVLEQQYQSQDQSQSQSQDQSHSHSHSQPPSQAGPAYNPPSAPAAQAVLPVADQQQYQQQAEQQQQQQQQQQQEQQQQQQQPTHQPTPHPLQPESRGPVPENMKSAVSAAESDWCETWNDQYKRPYFWNKVTGARQWREPAEHTEFKKSVEMRKREQDSADTSVGEHTTSEPEKPQERGLTREDMTEIVRNEIRDALETMSPTTHQQPQPQPQQQYLQHPQQQMAPREAHPSSFEYQQPSSRAESQQHVSPRVADDAPEWPGQVPAHPHHHPHQQPHAPSDYAYSEQHGSPYADPSHAQHAYSHHLPSELSAVGGGVQTYDGFSGYPGADEPASPLPHGVTYMTIPTDTGAEEQEQADDGYAHYINNGYAAQ